ncbi:MAG: SRPBCC family protein [Actinomycetota bacterium]
MQHRFSATIDAPPGRVYPLVADLARYPEFLAIVSRVEPADDAVTDEVDAWWVTLRARIGPFARSKRLRMVRTAAEPDRLVRFERAETDGREHSPWLLEAEIGAGDDGTSVVTMSLHYGGRLWSGPIEAVLQAEVPEAADRLARLATTTV